MKFLVNFCGKKTLVVLFITSLLALFLDLLSIALIFPFLKLFISPEIIQTNSNVHTVYQYMKFASTDQFIFTVGIGLVFIYLLKLALKTILNKVRFELGNTVTFRLATDLFKGLLNARYALFTEGSTSEMVGIINAHTIHSMICMESWIIILNEISFLFLLVGIFLILNPMVTVVILAIFAGVGIVLYFGLITRIGAYGQEHSKLNLLVYKFAFAVANSIKDIKIMGLEENYVDKFKKIWNDYSKNDSQAKTAKNIPKDFAETLVFSGIIAICLYILATKQNLLDLIPIIGVITVSAMRMLPSFIRIINSYNDFKYYRNSLVVVEDLYIKLQNSRQDVQRVNIKYDHSIDLKDVKFSYQHKTILDRVSFSIAKGSSVAFVGASGAGKSTLLDVLAGLREIDEGEFYMDSIKFDPFTTDALRTRIGYVPQQVSLIDESIAFNISFEEKYNREKMDKVVRMARLSPYLSELKDGLETVIGESGVRVSGGQRQRIGIARALYRDPEILIFDEATSALDNVTERELMGEINSLSGLKTLIIVAHRLSTVENSDIIYLLDQGTIIAQGTHKELLASCSTYQNMYNQQQH
jgi:ATP-binding cassette, subfamily B, bacterial PglK